MSDSRDPDDGKLVPWYADPRRTLTGNFDPRREFVNGNADNGDAVRKASAVFAVPQALLDDLGGFDATDLIGKAMRGEITLNPPPPPRRHRCIACWLVSLLPGHTRCPHGFLECEDCHEP